MATLATSTDLESCTMQPLANRVPDCDLPKAFGSDCFFPARIKKQLSNQADLKSSLASYTWNIPIPDQTITGSVFNGTTGNDTLRGTIGADTIIGGKGNDILFGGYNVGGTYDASFTGFYDSNYFDTFVFKKGDGKDVIQDAQSDLVNEYGFIHSRITFQDVASTEVNFSVSGSYLYINYGVNDSVKIFYPNLLTSIMGFLGTSLQAITFSDGVVWADAALKQNILANLFHNVSGGSGNDTLVGLTGENNLMMGLVGNDKLLGANFDDSILGGAGNDFLDGRGGFDTLVGGLGNDSYVFRAGGRVKIIENANEGTDLVYTDYSISLADSQNVENLILTGANNVDGYGNSLNNSIRGNAAANTLFGYAGNDVLNGFGGQDSLFGGAGNDKYIINKVDSATFVYENVGEGADTVVSAISYTLGDNLENLVLSENGKSYTFQGFNMISGGGWVNGHTIRAGDAVNGTGNALNNRITGNSNNNVITGAKGNDTLTGGGDSDTFVFSRGDGQDVITDFASNGHLVYINDARWVDENGNVVSDVDPTFDHGGDVINFKTGVSSDQLWFRHVGSDLLINTIGTTDSVLVKNWYTQNHTYPSYIKAADGKVLDSNKVENLVSAMAAFTAPTAGHTTLPTSYQSVLNPILAANWS